MKQRDSADGSRNCTREAVFREVEVEEVSELADGGGDAAGKLVGGDIEVREVG